MTTHVDVRLSGGASVAIGLGIAAVLAIGAGIGVVALARTVSIVEDPAELDELVARVLPGFEVPDPFVVCSSYSLPDADVLVVMPSDAQRAPLPVDQSEQLTIVVAVAGADATARTLLDIDAASTLMFDCVVGDDEPGVVERAVGPQTIAFTTKGVSFGSERGSLVSARVDRRGRTVVVSFAGTNGRMDWSVVDRFVSRLVE